ncbi:MAG: hypothetical protein II178_06060 [Selenomonadaceae bacterium]|nr:hypothetical protein [Selenomonadaceae bacterium]
MKDSLKLSTLGHTWIFDIDGTIVKHNGYKIDGRDTLLPGAREFLQSIPAKDMIIFLTSRTESYRQMTESFLKENGIRYEHIIFDAPPGERILINDDKPSGLPMCIGIRAQRDKWAGITASEDSSL